MEKEISLSLQIGVTLMVLSAVISLVAFTIHLGNDFKTETYQTGSRILTDLDEGYLPDMVGDDNNIPMATAYNLMRTYGRRITSLDCRVPECNHVGEPQNLVYDTPCLINHSGGLSGRVNLEVSNPYEGEYHIIVHPIN